MTLQPIIFLLLFTYVFGGAIAGGSQHDYLQFLLPGLLAQTIAFGRRRDRREPQRRHREGRLRPLPQPADRPVGAAGRRGPRRTSSATSLLCVVTLGFGYVIGFRVETTPLEALAAVPARDRLRAVLLLGLGVRRHARARTSGAVQGIMFLILFPLTLRQQHFVRRTRMPGWLQTFVDVNPITHLVGAVRGLMLGGPVRHAPAVDARWMAGLLAVFVPLALRAYRNRV